MQSCCCCVSFLSLCFFYLAAKRPSRLTFRLFKHSRTAGPEYQLVHPETGRVFPTYGFILVTGTMCLHFDPRIWPRPTEFLPERWVATSEDDPLYPTTKFAWRPFEYGPMGCIGQELALIELKMALLFTVRELDFKTALEEWDSER